MAFRAARFALGLGEAANFPAGIKAAAEWFPRLEEMYYYRVDPAGGFGLHVAYTGDERRIAVFEAPAFGWIHAST